MNRTRKAAAVGVLVAVGIGVGTGCSSLTEPWNDAPVHHKVDAPAVVFSMPDGFANYAEKCDQSGNLVLTTRSGSEGKGGKMVSMVHVPEICPKAGPPLRINGQ